MVDTAGAQADLAGRPRKGDEMTTATTEYLPNVTCLCPTYRAKPAALVGNAIACFLAQSYPADRRRLIVYDDTGHFEPVAGKGWELIVSRDRHPTLSNKYNHMVQTSLDSDVFVVWEDDDIYLPWHIESCVKALEGNLWAHPEKVFSLYTGKLETEPATGRLHASLAFRRKAWERLGGWPDTKRADFDLQMLANLRRTFGPPGNPVAAFPPSYVFRWASTGAPHGQNFMRGPGDEDWYRRAGEVPARGDRVVVPAFDPETARVILETKQGE